MTEDTTELQRKIERSQGDGAKRVLCKACGNLLGVASDYEPGDSVECSECESEYRIEENDHESVPIRVVTVHDERSQSREESLEEVVCREYRLTGGERTDGVLWLRSDGVRVREDMSEFEGEIPDDVDEVVVWEDDAGDVHRTPLGEVPADVREALE